MRECTNIVSGQRCPGQPDMTAQIDVLVGGKKLRGHVCQICGRIYREDGYAMRNMAGQRAKYLGGQVIFEASRLTN